MTPEREAYARYRLERARATVNEARVLLESGLLHGTVNRLYYACFYAVEALISTEGKSSSKHMGVKAFFDEGWVKPRRVPVESGRFYRQIYDDRLKADYGQAIALDADKVRSWFERASSFVDEIAKLVEAQIAKSSPNGR